MERDPMTRKLSLVQQARTLTRAEELTQFVCTAAALFFAAEQGENPAVRTYVDALHYVSTSLSVGYANIFPVTQAGKAIGALVQMVGPALSAKALDTDGPSSVLSLER
jgi:hypothetical protein